jgi:predicted metal-dependent HD superfamily phosphohydrolase
VKNHPFNENLKPCNSSRTVITSEYEIGHSFNPSQRFIVRRFSLTSIALYMSKSYEFATDVCKSSWEALCRDDLCLPIEAEQSIWKVIESKYNEPVRAYHTLEHICDLINIATPYRSKITDFNAVQLAIFFHDIIYDPTSSLNEDESAELFLDLMPKYIDENLVKKVTSYILATKSHHPPNLDDRDLSFFLDFDMSILGRERNEYSLYAKKIRREYKHVDEISFNKGRSAFLRKILMSNNPVFSTPEFLSEMELKARSNIEWEADELEKNFG